MDTEDIQLKIKKIEREMVVVMVELELIKLAKEVSMVTIEGFGKPGVKLPDPKRYANRIISIVKEHSI